MNSRTAGRVVKLSRALAIGNSGVHTAGSYRRRTGKLLATADSFYMVCSAGFTAAAIIIVLSPTPRSPPSILSGASPKLKCSQMSGILVRRNIITVRSWSLPNRAAFRADCQDAPRTAGLRLGRPRHKHTRLRTWS